MKKCFLFPAAFIIIINIFVISCSLMGGDDSEVNLPDVPLSDDGKLLTESAKYWRKKVAEFRTENPEIEPGGIIFLGDSITERAPFEEMFPNRRIINRGIGGDKIGGWKYYGLIDRMDVSVYDIEPSRLFIMIGINDIVYAHTPWSEMKDGVDRLFEDIKENIPGVEVYILSTLPARGTFAKYNTDVKKLNRFLKKKAEKFRFRFVDMYEYFCDDEGKLKEKYAADALHLNRRGYRVWEKINLPYVYK